METLKKCHPYTVLSPFLYSDNLLIFQSQIFRQLPSSDPADKPGHRR